MAEELEQDDIEYEEIEIDNNKPIIKTHELISKSLCGEIQEMREGYVEVLLETLDEMAVDELGLVHGGFIFSSADYAAMLSVNEKNVVLANSNSTFLSPVKVGDEILFKAKVRNLEGRKRYVGVKGYVLDVKVYEGEFKCVVTERHVLRLDLQDTAE